MEELVMTALGLILGLITGACFARYWLAVDFMRYTDTGDALYLGDRFHYILSPHQYNQLQICRMRCERMDARVKVVA